MLPRVLVLLALYSGSAATVFAADPTDEVRRSFTLAASDVAYLSQALIERHRSNSTNGLDAYAGRALSRVWKGERFSWWMTQMLHRFPESSGFDQRIQGAELEYLFSSKAAQTALAENYVGLPY